MQGVQVWPLVRELRSHMAWPKNKDLKIKNKPTTKKQRYIGKDKKRKNGEAPAVNHREWAIFSLGMKKQRNEVEFAEPSEKRSWEKKTSLAENVIEEWWVRGGKNTVGGRGKYPTFHPQISSVFQLTRSHGNIGSKFNLLDRAGRGREQWRKICVAKTLAEFGGRG